MRRRRQKNTLLPKMIGLAVLINAILLPVLAHFGEFKNIEGRQHLTPIELIKLPPVEKRPAPPKKAAKKVVAKARRSGHHVASHEASAHKAPSGAPLVRVVTAGTGAGGGTGSDSGITSSDTPLLPPTAAPPTPAPPTPTPPVPPPPTSVPTPPAPKPPVPVPPPAPPHVPTLTAAVPVKKPQPAIPDELRDSDFNSSFEGLFTVHPDGTASVKQISSTGNSTLDSLALDAARRWTFRPATRDGLPVESYLRLKVEFQVQS